MALLLTVTTGCGGLEVDVPDLGAEQRAACQDLVDALPESVADQPRREVDAEGVAAAWGDPAIVLRCGVPLPQEYDEFSACQVVEDVDWFAADELMQDQSADAVLTTIGREPAVELSLPAELRPPAAAMVDLAAVLKDHTDVVRRCR